VESWAAKNVEATSSQLVCEWLTTGTVCVAPAAPLPPSTRAVCQDSSTSAGSGSVRGGADTPLDEGHSSSLTSPATLHTCSLADGTGKQQQDSGATLCTTGTPTSTGIRSSVPLLHRLEMGLQSHGELLNSPPYRVYGRYVSATGRCLDET
jgi:hypothetical protein